MPLPSAPLYVTLPAAEDLKQGVIYSNRTAKKVDARIAKTIRSTDRSIVVRTPSSGLPQRNGVNVTPIECDVWNLEETAKDVWQLIETTKKVFVYNFLESAVAGDSYVIAEIERSGQYCVKAIDQTIGVFRVTFRQDFSFDDSIVDCNVSKSDLAVGSSISANNLMQLESDSGMYGYCLLFADGTVDLIAAQCPEESEV